MRRWSDGTDSAVHGTICPNLRVVRSVAVHTAKPGDSAAYGDEVIEEAFVHDFETDDTALATGASDAV